MVNSMTSPSPIQYLVVTRLHARDIEISERAVQGVQMGEGSGEDVGSVRDDQLDELEGMMFVDDDAYLNVS